MKMAAGLLFRRAAGMKDGGALFRWNAGKFQLLERRRWNGGDSRPMLDHFWRQTERLADYPIGGVVFKLKREKLERESIKLIALRLPRRSEAKAGGEAGKLFVHAVFVHGWFSATADRQYSSKSSSRN